MKKLIFTLLFTLACAAIFSAAPTKKDFDEWNSLTEDERMLCLLTDPYVSDDGLKTTSVNPEPVNKGKKSIDRLNNGWGAYSRKDVLQWYVTKMNGLCRVNYESAKELYNRYPGSTVEEIAIAECLYLEDLPYLIFYADNHEKLGEYAFLALDAVKILTPLRYAVAANWITEQEAVEFAKPVLDEVANAFYSYEDFIAHYTLENSLMSLIGVISTNIDTYNKQNVPAVLARYAKPSSSKYAINYDIKFPAQKQNGNPILTYDDVFYTPDEDSLKLYALRRWVYRENDRLSTEEVKKLKSYIEEKKYIPAVAYRGLLVDGENKDYEGMKDYLKAFDNAGTKTSLYHMAYILYGEYCAMTPQGKEYLLWAIEKQEGEKSYYFLRSIYNVFQLMELVNSSLPGDDFFSIVSVLAEPASEMLDNYNKAVSAFSATEFDSLDWELREMYTELYLFANCVCFAFNAKNSIVSFLARNNEEAYDCAKKAREILNYFVENEMENELRDFFGSKDFDEYLSDLEFVENKFNKRYIPNN